MTQTHLGDGGDLHTCSNEAYAKGNAGDTQAMHFVNLGGPTFGESTRGKWQLRFAGEMSFQCLGTFNGPTPRIGEKVCYLRNDGIHTAEVKDVVYHVYPSGITDVMVYIDPPKEPGIDL